MNAKILMLTQTVFPPDIRLEKEIRSLYQSGYKVLVICNQYDKTKNPDFKFCEIIRISALFNDTKLNKIINFPFFLNPRYLISVYKNIIKFKPNFIHAHDLPMIPIAILFGKLIRVPIIFDMHENYPEALKVFQKKGLANFILKNYRLAKVLEKICIKLVDKILVVVEENKKRLIKQGANPDLIHVISNTVDLDTFQINIRNGIKLPASLKEKIIVLYSGTVSPDRGLITPIMGIKYLKQSNSEIIFLIIGEGSAKEELQNIVIDEELTDNVIFMEWPGHNLLPSLIQEASICVIPQPSNQFIDTTIPHKLFEYMAIGKPVLVSDAVPLKRIVNETKAGLVFESNNSIDFAKILLEMINSKHNWGDNGRKAVENKYNWKNESLALINLYNGLLS